MKKVLIVLIVVTIELFAFFYFIPELRQYLPDIKKQFSNIENYVSNVSSFFKSKEDMLKGKWELVESVVYSDGKLHPGVKRSYKMNYFLGSKSKPKYFIFSKYDEMLWDTYPVGDRYNRNAAQYQLEGDKIILDIDKVFYIEDISPTQLIIREELIIDYYDKTKLHPKMYYIWTLSKVEN